MSEQVNRALIPFTGEHFATFCLKMVGQPYWFGSCLYKCNNSLLTRKTEQYPSHYGASRMKQYKQNITDKKVAADCMRCTSLVIDVTTFTHETLAMLLKLVFENKDKFRSVLCLYNGASDYSNSRNVGLNQMWLSNGCKDVRNIVGFPGLMRPAAQTTLIILTGFEWERATRLIELLEPDKLVLGVGSDPTHPNNHEAMKHFREMFADWKENYKHNNCEEIVFSCKNIDVTVDVLTKEISKAKGDNFIIVPLNTKLSTIAATIVAYANNKIQLCYAIPEIYNTKEYSSPGEKITVLNLYDVEAIAQGIGKENLQ